MLKDKDIIVLGGDNVNTLGIIRTLGEANLDFTSIIIKSTFVQASKSKYLRNRKAYLVDTIDTAYSLLINLNLKSKNKALLLVEGDLNTGYLDRHYNDLVGKYVWNNAGKQGKLTKYIDKNCQNELAKECGFKYIPSILVNRGEIPENLEYPIITKAVTSEIDNWKSEVHICRNKDELIEAYKYIKSDQILIQKFIKKKNELCLDGFSINRGNEQCITIASTYNYLIDTGFSYYCTVRNFNDDNTIQNIKEMMSKIGYEGIYSFEFIIDENDEAYFMEINFRNSGWSYASTCLGMPLPILWMESMISHNLNENIIKLIPNNFTFVLDFNDFKSRAGKLVSYSKWFKQYINCGCRLEMGRYDYLAFFSYLFSRFKHKIFKSK